jgi:ABC-type multidrug transport system fused ATPase/permease subunit
VIENGKLAECGTHDELLAKPDGVYRRLYRLQQEVNDAA